MVQILGFHWSQGKNLILEAFWAHFTLKYLKTGVPLRVTDVDIFCSHWSQESDGIIGFWQLPTVYERFTLQSTLRSAEGALGPSGQGAFAPTVVQGP